jgi:hypothetical protein
MYGRGDCVEKAGIGIGRKINGNRCLGCDRSDDLDIEHDFAIRAGSVAGRTIGPVIDRYGHHGRRVRSKAREIGVQVRRTVTAAKLD